MDEMIMQCESCGDSNCCERCDLAGEPILCDECYMSAKEFEPERADCSKCVTDCRSKEHFEHEMWVQKNGCSNFKSRGERK